MTIEELPTFVRPALVRLQEMLQHFWAQELPAEEIPLEFWTIADDDVFFDALQYLPSCMFVYGGSSGNGHSDQDIARLPEGLRLAVTIFELEEGFDTEGWTAISNLGEHKLRLIVAAYRRMGLASRAAALERVLTAYLLCPEEDDQDAYMAAAAGELPDLRDDEDALNTVFAFLRSDRDTLFGKIA